MIIAQKFSIKNFGQFIDSINCRFDLKNEQAEKLKSIQEESEILIEISDKNGKKWNLKVQKTEIHFKIHLEPIRDIDIFKNIFKYFFNKYVFIFICFLFVVVVIDKALNQYKIKKWVATSEIEVSVVKEKNIENYIELLIKQFSDVTLEYQSKLRSIKYLLFPKQDKFKFYDKSENNSYYKIVLITVQRLEFTFRFSVKTIKREIKLVSLKKALQNWLFKEDTKFDELLIEFD